LVPDEEEGDLGLRLTHGDSASKVRMKTLPVKVYLTG